LPPFHLTGLRGARRTRRLAQLIAVTDVLTWKLLRPDRLRAKVRQAIRLRDGASRIQEAFAAAGAPAAAADAFETRLLEGRPRQKLPS
jgi:UDP:flavonoid glycosyltransferase YjiC (YdhE family)